MANETTTIEPKHLAAKLGISPKRVRQILRADYPRDVRKKRWEIPTTLAKKVEKDFKAKVREREAKKQAEIEKQLKGEK